MARHKFDPGTTLDDDFWGCTPVAKPKLWPFDRDDVMRACDELQQWADRTLWLTDQAKYRRVQERIRQLRQRCFTTKSPPGKYTTRKDPGPDVSTVLAPDPSEPISEHWWVQKLKRQRAERLAKRLPSSGGGMVFSD